MDYVSLIVKNFQHVSCIDLSSHSPSNHIITVLLAVETILPGLKQGPWIEWKITFDWKILDLTQC